MLELLAANLPMALCLVIGMCLIVAEVFLPGFGLPGISGIALVAVGIVMAGLHFGALVAVGILLVLIAVLAVVISFVLRSAAKGSVGRELFLADREELGSAADMRAFVGRRGVTLSVLRPAGIGDFDGVRLNVVTEGGFIEKGAPVEIVSASGARIVVRQLPGEAGQAQE